MLIPKIQFSLIQNTQFKELTDNNKTRDKIYIFNHVNDATFIENYENLSAPVTIKMPVDKLFCKEFNPTVDSIELNITAGSTLDDVSRIILNATNKKINDIKSINIGGRNVKLPNGAIQTKNIIHQVGNTVAPKFAIGDRIDLVMAYANPATNDVLISGNTDYKTNIFTNNYFITGLDLNDTLDITLDNYSYFLKQTLMPSKVLPAGSDIIEAVEDAIKLVNKNKIFTLGNTDRPISIKVMFDEKDSLTFNDKLIINANLTVAQFLAELKSKYNILSFFDGDTLVIGLSVGFYSNNVYLNDNIDRKSKTIPEFKFRENIISSDLKYRNKESILLSAIVSNHFHTAKNGVTKDGQAKTKKSRMSVYISIQSSKIKEDQSFDIGDIKSLVLYNEKGEKINDIPPLDTEGIDGQRFDFSFPWAKSIDDLKRLGSQELSKFYYDGYEGSFETFGEPVTYPGYIIKITDDLYPEKNGKYRVKAVERNFGLNGYRQKITLDIKIP